MRFQYVILAALAVLFCPPGIAEASPDAYASIGAGICLPSAYEYDSEEDDLQISWHNCSNLIATLGLELRDNMAFEVRSMRTTTPLTDEFDFGALYAFRSESDWSDGGSQSEWYIGAAGEDSDIFLGFGYRMLVPSNARMFVSVRLEYFFVANSTLTLNAAIGYKL